MVIQQKGGVGNGWVLLVTQLGRGGVHPGLAASVAAADS